MSHIVVVQVLNAKQDLLDEEARLERNIKYKKKQEWSKKNSSSVSRRYSRYKK